MAAIQNSSFASPLADAKASQIVGNPQIDGILSKVLELSGWTIALTILAVLVAYDQCTSSAILNLLEPLLIFLQVATFGRRDQSLAQHGRSPSSDPFSSP